MNNNKWLVLLFLTFGILLYAGTSRGDDFQVPPKPDHGWYIADPAGALSISDRDILNRKIDGVNKSSRNEIGVALVPTLGDTSITDAAQDTFHAWGIGKAGLDNGVLILIATKDRKIRIQTGNGAEGDLPDSVCNQIIRDSRQFYSKQDWAGGLNYDIDQIKSKMDSRVGQAPIVPQKKNHANNNVAGSIAVLFLGGLFVIGIIVWIVARRRRNWDYMSHDYGSPSYTRPATPQSYHVPDPHHVATRPVKTSTVAKAATVAAGVGVAASLAEKRRRQASEDASRAQRDAQRREAATPTRSSSSDDDSSSSSSSGGFWESGSSSSDGGGGGGWDGGGGFGGGDSGGGGADGSF